MKKKALKFFLFKKNSNFAGRYCIYIKFDFYNYNLIELLTISKVFFMKKVFSLGLLIAAMTLIAFPSCKKDKKVTGVKLSETTKSIVVGGEFVLTATVSPTDAANKDVTWSTDKPAVATVENGKVKGIAVGEATITVTTKDGNKTDKCKVTVTKKPIAVTGVTLSAEEKMLKVGSEFTLTATVAPSNATNKEVTWTSDKADIATVDNNGKVKGVKEGDAIITVTTKDGEKKATCKVTVFNTVKTDILWFAYRGNLGVEGKHFYTIILTDKGMVSGGKIVKDGRGYYITICSDAPKSATDFTPRMGTYKMGQPKQFEPMFIVNHKGFTFTSKIKSNKWEQPTSPFTEGELVVEANKITFKGKDANDAEYDLVFDGTYTVEDASPKPFADEPEEKTTITKEWKSGQIKMGKVAGNKKPFLLSTDRNSESMATFVWFWEKADATKLDGTYNVSDSEEPKTVVKSKGMSGSSVYYSFYSKLTEDGYVDKPYYFFDHGTVTVTAGKIEMHVTSHFGSTLNLTYSGDMTPKANTAPQKARVYMSPLKKLRMETPRLR